MKTSLAELRSRISSRRCQEVVEVKLVVEVELVAVVVAAAAGVVVVVVVVVASWQLLARTLRITVKNQDLALRPKAPSLQREVRSMVSDIGNQNSHIAYSFLNHSKPSLSIFAHPTAGHAVILPSADRCP